MSGYNRSEPARREIRSVLERYGISVAYFTIDEIENEEIIFIEKNDYDPAIEEQLTLDIMKVLPHTKVWVIPKKDAYKVIAI